MIWLGGLIVVLTFVAIVKKYETRLVLFMSGLIMATLSGKAGEAVTAFTKAIVNSGLVPVICTVMGFAFVMKLTKCDKHLVHLLAGALKKVKPVLVPGAVIVTWVINIAIPSAAGCSAAVGAVLIPTLIGAGVHPAIAASAVMAGTWGSVLSPGTAHNPFIAKLANVDVMTVIGNNTIPALIGLAIVAIGLTITAYMRKEIGIEVANDDAQADKGEKFSVNYLKAIVPVLPLVLLVIGSKQVGLIPTINVPTAMLIGCAVGFLVTLREISVEDVSTQFFKGMGEAYGSVIGIIVAAAVFTQGMQLIGLTGAFIDVMKQSDSIAKIASTAGPFLIAVLCGSGDAATLAFNGAITPHAEQFGFGKIELGSQAFLAGSLGRSMSPVAGAAIICAQLASVSTMEIVKRNGPVMIIAALVIMMILL